MLLTYCEDCGYLIQNDSHQLKSRCETCESGERPKPAATRTRDSGQITYATRPSTGAILAEIRQNVRLSDER